MDNYIMENLKRTFSNNINIQTNNRESKDNVMDKVLLYQSALELNKINEYAKKTIKEIESQYFFDLLQVLLEIINRKDAEIMELNEKLEDMETNNMPKGEQNEEFKEENC